MGTQVIYEWRVNKCSEYGDIEHFDTFDSYKEAREWERQLHAHGMDLREYTEIELGRDVWCDDNGLQERGYATVNEDGSLPERFCCGAKVPAYLTKYLKIKEAK